MNIKIDMSGMEKLQRELEETRQAMKSLDGELARVQFNPNDSTSVDRAVSEMKGAVDAKTARYRSNPLVKAMVDASKQSFEKRIRETRA